MEQLVETLINKRLGINENNDINTSLLSGEYYHMACVIDSIKSKIIPLSYGMNQYFSSKTIHAECDAINHLPPRRKTSRNKIINLVVIRTSKNKKVSISKPCLHCMNFLCSKPQMRGYQINKIFYSDQLGNIIESSICDLQESTCHISKFYRNIF